MQVIRQTVGEHQVVNARTFGILAVLLAFLHKVFRLQHTLIEQYAAEVVAILGGHIGRNVLQCFRGFLRLTQLHADHPVPVRRCGQRVHAVLLHQRLAVCMSDFRLFIHAAEVARHAQIVPAFPVFRVFQRRQFQVGRRLRVFLAPNQLAAAPETHQAVKGGIHQSLGEALHRFVGLSRVQQFQPLLLQQVRVAFLIPENFARHGSRPSFLFLQGTLHKKTRKVQCPLIRKMERRIRRSTLNVVPFYTISFRLSNAIFGLFGRFRA